MASISDFKVGDKVTFGRGNGEQTNGTVVKVNQVKLKVRQDESRGRSRNHAVGTVWTVPPTLCRKVTLLANAEAPAPVRVKRSESDILADAKSILFQLEPEVLHCDGEITGAQARRRAQHLRSKFKALEVELGRPITEFGSVDGAMPVTITNFVPRTLPKFARGDKVTFDTKDGIVVVGFVKRINAKTITVTPIGNGSRYWRVSPNMLRAAV